MKDPSQMFHSKSSDGEVGSVLSQFYRYKKLMLHEPMSDSGSVRLSIPLLLNPRKYNQGPEGIQVETAFPQPRHGSDSAGRKNKILPRHLCSHPNQGTIWPLETFITILGLVFLGLQVLAVWTFLTFPEVGPGLKFHIWCSVTCL